MPNRSNVIGTWLTMDTQDFVTGAHEAVEAMNNLRREFEASQDGGRRWEKSIQGVEHRMQYLNKQIEVQRRLQEVYRKQVNELSKDEEKNASSIASKNKGIDNAQIKINKYADQLERCRGILERLTAEEREANSALGKLRATINQQEHDLAELVVQWKNAVLQYGKGSKEALELEDRIESLNKDLRQNRSMLAQIDGTADAMTATVDRLGKGFTVLKGVLSNLATDALYRLFAMMKDGFESAMEWESSFTGVTRTVEGTPAQMTALEQSLLGLGTNVATPLSGIADIAAMAGQMGIAVEDISDFTRVMIMLGDTTNISAEEAGDSLARLSNLLNVTSDDYERMGSVLVDLGNKFPTTESEIASMASRLGGTANMLGIATADVFGLANAISAVGLEAEMGGNAISKTLREMQLAVENGNEKLAVFADTAGMTVSEFQQLFKSDSIGALTAFIGGLGDVAANGASATQILSELNITELRQVDVLTRMASNYDTLEQSLRVARTAWDENAALVSEANKRYQTLKSRVQMMKNAWAQVSVEISKSLNPALKGAVDWMTTVARSLVGQKGASEDLDVALTDLRDKVNEYKKAQEEAAGATDNLTKAMAQQRLEAMRSSMTSLIDTYNASVAEASTYKAEEASARYNLMHLFSDRFATQGMQAEYLKETLGFDAFDSETILALYPRLDEFREILKEEVDKGGWFDYTDSELRHDAFSILVELLEKADPLIDKLNAQTEATEASLARVKANQEAAIEGYFDLYSMLDDEGNHIVSILDFPALDEDAKALFKTIEKGWNDADKVLSNGYLESLNLTEDTLQQMIDATRERMEGMTQFDSEYWGSMRSIDVMTAYAGTQGWHINPNGTGNANPLAVSEPYSVGQTANELWDRMVRERNDEALVNVLMGLPMDYSGFYESWIQQFQQYVSSHETLVKQLEDAYQEALDAGDAARAADIQAQIQANKEEIAIAREHRNTVASYYKPEEGEDPEDEEDNRSWWRRFTDSLVNDDVAYFGAGLEDMVSDLTDLWNQLGQGILDTIDMWFDAEIESIDRAIEHLEEQLEKEQELLDYQANSRQAKLNEQLKKGLIDEEQYEEASQANREHAEAAKYEASMEGQQKLEEINERRDALERQQFEAQKANSIADVWISAAQGIAAAWGRGEPISAGIITGLISAMAAVQTGIIASQKYTPALAKGGIVSSPTMALIGEAGREAVMPLENNTEWIRQLAEQISNAMGYDGINRAIARDTDRVGVTTSNISNKQEFTQIINSPKALNRIEIYRDTRRLFKQFGRK